MWRAWLAIALWKRVLLGLVVGMAVGLGLHYGLGPDRASVIGETWMRPFGDAFVRLIQMMVVPLITTTLIAGVTAMGDPKKLGSLGGRAIGLYMVTTLFAVCLGLAVGTLFKPGVGVQYQVAGDADKASVETKLKAAEEAGSMSQRFVQIIPANPVKALVDVDVLAIIFFAILFGVAILLTGEAANPVRLFFESASEVVMRMTLFVMEAAPYGVAALMAWVMATKGIGVLSNLMWMAICLYLACAIQIVAVYGLVIIKFICRLPLVPFYRGAADAASVAFSTASSNATLPVSISCAEKNLGVDKSIAGSVLPLGATINMDGTSIYLGLIALFAAQAAGTELSWAQYVNVALTATLVSIGAAGIPSAGLLLAATVLNVIGVSTEQALLVIAFIFPFDRLLDMMRTMTNVLGDLACACAVANWEGALDREEFVSEIDT